MADAIETVLDRIEQQRDELELPPGATPLDFLEAVYRSPAQPIFQRMKAAIEAAQYRHARLAVTATVTTEDFAAMLDKAIERSGKAQELKQIESKPRNPTPPTPPPASSRLGPVPDRRFRRG
jgi:hypothetical protein